MPTMLNELEPIVKLVNKEMGNKHIVVIPFSKIEPLIEPSVEFATQEKKFKYALKMDMEKLGYSITSIGKDWRFEHSGANNEVVLENKIETVKNHLKTFSNSNTFSKFKNTYVFPNNFEYVKYAVENGMYPLLVGEPSSGKSRMGEEIAIRLSNSSGGRGRPCFRQNLEEITEVEDFVGRIQLVTNPQTRTTETAFVPGLLLEAWTKGWVLILDEIDRSSKAARKALNMVTEVGSKLYINTHEGVKYVEKHPDCAFIFTSNTWGHGDDLGIFDGAEQINSAWLSRIGPKFEVKTDYEIHRAVLKEEKLPDNVINLLYTPPINPNDPYTGIVVRMKDCIKQNGLTEFVMLRYLQRFAQCYQKFGFLYGLEICLINEFKEYNREAMRDCVAADLNILLKPTEDFSVINSEKTQTELKSRGLI